MSVFRRVVIVVLENASRDTVLTNKYMRDLRKKGVFLANSHCVTHPSQPNYFTMVGGDTLGIVNDNSGWVYWTQTTATIPGTDKYPDVTSIADLLEYKGLTWKAYAEDLPTDLNGYTPAPFIKPSAFGAGPFSLPSDTDLFTRRHVPFLSFPNIVNNPERLKNIVNADDFITDLQNGSLPHYSFYTPNLINDGHAYNPQHINASPFVDTYRLQDTQAFLEVFLGEDPIAKFPPETLIVITYDESYGADVAYNIYTLLIGDMLTAGTVRYEPYNHYSLLRTIEDNFAIGTLGRNDAAATPYWFMRE